MHEPSTVDPSEALAELEVAARIAREAGALILQYYETAYTIESKGQAGPVTEADKRANALIIERLARQFPRDVIVAEESPLPEGPLDHARVWYVDPLDGTKEFIAKNGEFSVMIGLAVQGRAHLGAVYQPTAQVLYLGVSDYAAWIDSHGQRTTMHVSSTQRPQDLRLAVSRSHRHPLLDAIRQKTGIAQEIRHGSVGLKIGLIATQRADVYIEPGPYTCAWDACAPEAILRGAGGRFTDLFGHPLQYGASGFRNTHGIVATNGACHDWLIHVIAAVLGDSASRLTGFSTGS